MEKLVEEKIVFLPLISKPICPHYFGHPFIRGDLVCGNEEEVKHVVRDGVTYRTSVEYGECSKCNKNIDKIINKQIDEYIKNNGLKNV